jgi:hypothetical protein
LKKYSRPSRLLKLILTYGEQAVFEAGDAFLGYPGTWITDRDEAMKLEIFMNEKYKEKTTCLE